MSLDDLILAKEAPGLEESSPAAKEHQAIREKQKWVRSPALRGSNLLQTEIKCNRCAKLPLGGPQCKERYSGIHRWREYRVQ